MNPTKSVIEAQPVENPYQTPTTVDEQSQVDHVDAKPQRWQWLLGASFAFPFLVSTIMVVLDELAGITVSGNLIVWPFAISLVGVIGSLAISRETIAARVGYFLMTLFAYPIAFVCWGITMMMVIGFSAT